MVTSTKKITESQKELEDLLIQASNNARTKVRSNVEYIDAEVQDWYEYGNDKNTGDLIQPLEVKVGDEELVRKYVIKGTDAIVSCFGKPAKKGDSILYSEVTYNEKGVPTHCKVPDIEPNAQDGSRWFTISKS